MTNYRKTWIQTFGPIIKGFQVHHIKPRSEGGGDNLGNLIALHRDDHVLIHKMRGDKVSEGFIRMKNHYTPKHTEKAKRKISIAQKGKGNSMYGKPHPKGMLGKAHSVEACKKIGKAKLGSNNPTLDPKLLRTCIHCNKTMNKSHINQWHNEKCKRR